jgi:hypothetical protein
MKRSILVGLIVCAVAGAGCRSDTTAPPDYSIVTPVTETFQGSLSAQGSAFYSFVVGNPDPISITLASLTKSSGAAVTTSVRLGFGVPAGETCAPTTTVTTTSGLQAQVLQVITPGTYCVIISDNGALTEALTFAIKIKHS